MENRGASELTYGLHDRPPLGATLLAASQHVLAVFVGIVTPPLLICNALHVDLQETTYVVSMSLVVSGIATFIQTRRMGPIGSGLLSIQGTSFSFVGPLIACGGAVIAGGGAPQGALATILGVCAAGALVEIVLSRFLHLARRIITPLVTGIVVTLIGLTLIKVGVTSLGGGVAALEQHTFGNLRDLGLGVLVLATVVLLNASRNPILRMSAVFIALALGYVVALIGGWVDLSGLGSLPWLAVPMPLRYGLAFDWSALVPVGLIYLVTMLETVGDLTATSAVSGEPISGALYTERIRGGVLGDGLNSLLAALFNTFPNTTFSQNNGVIQLTGVASRQVGFVVAGLLVLLGAFPAVGGLLRAMPEAVLGGATLMMFGTVAAAGVRIIATQPLDRRAVIILAPSLAVGLGVTFAPELLSHLPAVVGGALSSGIASGGLVALTLNLVLPRPPA